MDAARSSNRQSTQPHGYSGFSGLETSRDPIAMDTGENQRLLKLQNGFCDRRGHIVRDPIVKKLAGEYPVTHVRHYGRDKLCWAERRGNGIALNSDAGHLQEEIYPKSATVTSTVFNKQVIFTARGLPSYSYDGTIFSRINSQALDDLRPAFSASVQRRLVVAGIPGRETEVHISRVDQDNVFPDDEKEDEQNVLRAGYIDVANLLGTRDEITGISQFEQSKLAVFTNDRAFIYQLDPDINLWRLDDNANINTGCIAHNTIARAGNDIFFCSRDGVHTIRRSEENGIIVYSRPMSDEVDILYRQLVSQAHDMSEITAVYDQDEGQYHIFFPLQGDQLTRRLTLTVGDKNSGTWSTADFIFMRCGAFMAGQLVLGAADGIYEIGNIEDKDGISPQMEVLTPLLWLGSMTTNKQTHSIILQAYGNGSLTLEAISDDGTIFWGKTVEIDGAADDDYYSDVPLSQQFEIPFQHTVRGMQLRIKTEGTGLLRIIGFAITTKR